MDRDLLRGDIVPAAHLLRQFEHPRKHRWDELAVGHPIAFDKGQKLLGVEMLHDDRRTARTDCQTDPDIRRCVIERRRER